MGLPAVIIVISADWRLMVLIRSDFLKLGTIHPVRHGRCIRLGLGIIFRAIVMRPAPLVVPGIEAFDHAGISRLCALDRHSTDMVLAK